LPLFFFFINAISTGAGIASEYELDDRGKFEEDNIEIYRTEIEGWFYFVGLGWSPVTGSCEYQNGSSNSINYEKVLN
jgi:hypothetical protein